jgi:outer membrane beta-barrel protein
MKPLAIAALLFASVAQAHGALLPEPTNLVIRQAGGNDSGQTSTPSDDDEGAGDESADATKGGLPGTHVGGPAAAAPAQPAAPSATTSSAANPRAQELVSGAPLYNPNVAVHIVEKKQFSDKGKQEIALYPAVAQVNGKFTQHFGSALSYTYHVHENFGFQVMPIFNWSNTESGFNQELVNKVREEAQAATSLLLNWGATAGVDVAPIYGKFAWYDSTMAHYSLVLTGGAGYGSTRHELKPVNDAGPATFGDTGNRFIGQLGAGFRVLLGDRFAIRAEVRDIVYTAQIDTVNGCTKDDLTAMSAATRSDQGPNAAASANVSSGCRVSSFTGTNGGYERRNDVPLALNLVNVATSDVLNLVSFYGGVSFLF